VGAAASDIVWLSATEIADSIARRELSAREATSAYLGRVDTLKSLGAYRKITGEHALAQADAIDAALARGEKPGPLAGVPLALKDIFVTRGIETTCGSKILEGFVPPYEGTPSRKLGEAGAILLGKLNMDEFAMGSSNENTPFETVRNPWKTDRVPGGSSGGSAAAVAAALCAGTLGTDTGGSIRQPAAVSGVVGLKPTYGRVSRYGVIAFASSLDQVGPLGRTVSDCALLLEAIAGHDPMDATSIDAPVPRYRDAVGRGVKGLRLGVPEEYFGEGLDPEIEKAVREAIRELERQGAQVVPISLPSTPQAIAVYYVIATAEASSNLARYDGIRYGHRVDEPRDLLDLYMRTRAEGFGREVKRRIMLGTYVLRAGYYEAYYGRAQKVRTLIRREFEQAFAKCDAIVTPTSPVTAFKIGERMADPLAMYLADAYTIGCNLAGLPGMSVPCGFSGEGLPIGLQILGPTLGEETCLRVGGAYEAATEWHKRRPQGVA
jgi:aspartyl-tRNA(Asn)/glutamyl-tRNA(Gln) amidotransferase subunit A